MRAPTVQTPCVRCFLSTRPALKIARSYTRSLRRSPTATRSSAAAQYNLLLDCDGVLVDTEAQGHRVSFNNAFKQKGTLWLFTSAVGSPAHSDFSSGLDFSWSEKEYGHLLAIGGGKERMTHYFTVS